MNSDTPLKTLWTDADFAEMGWHDATLWSMVANPDDYEFLVDLDYIFEWVCPAAGETHYKFQVAPVTMVFENAHSIEITLESPQGTIEVADLHREHPTLTPNGELTEHGYRFECQEGEVKLRATGFKMFVRQRPVLLGQQSLSLAARGGVSFARRGSAL
jgi:hypothetical protein